MNGAVNGHAASADAGEREARQTPRPLEGKVAVVAGATRGAGRGIARMLGEAGATVYCTGRSTRSEMREDRPADASPFETEQRPETIEETAEMVSALGGTGIPVRVDHTVEADVVELFDRVRQEQEGLDLLVNDVWGGDALTERGASFWDLSIAKGMLLLDRAVGAHIRTSRHAAPLIIQRGAGLIVEITDAISFAYQWNLFYDLAKVSAIRLAFAMAEELRPYNVAAVALTPGFLRSEAMLEHFGVTEANWRDGAAVDRHFAQSETPTYLGRGVAALAGDADVMAKSGRVFSSAALAREYGFTDADGRRPDFEEYLATSTDPDLVDLRTAMAHSHAAFVGAFGNTARS